MIDILLTVGMGRFLPPTLNAQKKSLPTTATKTVIRRLNIGDRTVNRK
jgi:hypothetical protein